MSSNKATIAIEAQTASSNPLNVIPDEVPFDVPYVPSSFTGSFKKARSYSHVQIHGSPIPLDQAEAVVQALVVEAKKRSWKMRWAAVIRASVGRLAIDNAGPASPESAIAIHN